VAMIATCRHLIQSLSCFLVSDAGRLWIATCLGKHQSRSIDSEGTSSGLLISHHWIRTLAQVTWAILLFASSVLLVLVVLRLKARAPWTKWSSSVSTSGTK
jgi:hypothetical protein